MRLTTNLRARNIGVALQARRAYTDSLVSLRLARCSASTNCEWARVHTFVGLASLVKGTILISLTLHWGEKRSWKNLPKCPTFSTKHWTYIGNIPGVDFLPSSLGICRLGYDWMFDRWHSCRRGLFHKGQHSSFLCRPCHWDTHHHAGIPLFWLWKKSKQNISSLPILKRSVLQCCWLTLHTSPERIPCKSRWTLALGSVVFYKTGCIWAAGVVGDAWIDTISKVASFIPWAFLIWLATNWLRYNWWE